MGRMKDLKKKADLLYCLNTYIYIIFSYIIFFGDKNDFLYICAGNVTF